MEINRKYLSNLKNNRKFHYLLISLVFNTVIHLIIALIYYNPVDFVLQFEAAKEIARGKLLYRDIGEFIIPGDVRLPRPQYPPLYLYSLALFVSLIGIEVFTWQMAKIFLVTFNILVGLLIYYLAIILSQNYQNKEKIAIIAMNWFLLNPITLGIVFGGYHEGFMLFFVLIAYITFIKDKYVLSGVFFGLGLLVKPTVGIYMIPLIFWGFQKHDFGTLKIWIIAFTVFLFGSLPFLLIVPEIYLQDVFFVHTQRPDPSMSMYVYILQIFSTTMVPFIIQLILILIILIFLHFKVKNPDKSVVIETVLPIMSIFLAFNRILYPHYIPFIFPFFTLNFLIFSLKPDSLDRYKKLVLLIPLFCIYIGIITWSILWIIEGYQTYLMNPLFPFTAFICIFGLVLLSMLAIYYLYKRYKIKEENIVIRI